MTDDEFEVLDEVYFVQSFHQILEATGKENNILIKVLSSLYDKGWIRVFKEVDDEVPVNELNFEVHAGDYLYLATKQGLMAHNTTD